MSAISPFHTKAKAESQAKTEAAKDEHAIAQCSSFPSLINCFPKASTK